MVVAIIEVVSKVERDIRGGDLDSNMSHPSFPMFWKCFHQEKYVQYGLNISTITILKISLWRICFFAAAETDSSPSFYWHRDSDCELWGQIFPLKKGRKKNRKPLIFVSWGMCKNEWDLSQISVFCRHCLSFSKIKRPKILKVSKNHKIQYVSTKTKIFRLFWK